MFTADERGSLQDRLLARAEADACIVGAPFTGSHATGESDRWSDTDLVLAVQGDLLPVVDRWTRWLYSELSAQHHWDLPAGSRIIRVFLLPGWLEIDLTFAPEAEFGPRGPQWRTVFGTAQPPEPFAAPDRNTLAGFIWHHALHARICIERGRWWQAEYWISAIREHTVTLASLRLGYPAEHARGAHLLPGDLTAQLEATLLQSLAEPELNRALTPPSAPPPASSNGAIPHSRAACGPCSQNWQAATWAQQSTRKVARVVRRGGRIVRGGSRSLLAAESREQARQHQRAGDAG